MGRALFESVGAIHWVWAGLAGTVRVLGQSECARIPALAKRGVVSYTYVEGDAASAKSPAVGRSAALGKNNKKNMKNSQNLKLSPKKQSVVAWATQQNRKNSLWLGGRPPRRPGKKSKK